MAAYCTADQFLNRWDWRSVGRLLEDVAAGGTPTLTSRSAVAGSAMLAELLQEASGEVEMSCTKGARYSTDDLAALAGTNGGLKLAGLVADLTMWRVFDRRPDRTGKMPQRCEEAQKLLVRLEEGEIIWPIQKAADAGHLHSDTITPQDVETRDDRTITAERYFGRRNDRERRRLR